ncbi:MAG: hypothetical protein LBS21_15275 [Clostridiales bacterium]|jgi:hypothetical protein|nr:hypothetical protein [Clostridiales bacterium]
MRNFIFAMAVVLSFFVFSGCGENGEASNDAFPERSKKSTQDDRQDNEDGDAPSEMENSVAAPALQAFEIDTETEKYGQVKGNISFFPGGSAVTVYTNGNGKESIEGQITTEPKWSLDGTKAAFMVVDLEDLWSFGKTYSLYTVTEELQLIDEGVVDFKLSASGDAIVYAKALDSDEEIAELWLYSDGKKTIISDEYYTGSSNVNFAVSPKGDAVSYVVRNDDGYVGFIWDGKAQEFGKDVEPFAISDGAKYVYYKDNSGYFVQKGTNKDTMQEIGGDFFANIDLSQLVFSSEEGTFIIRDGDEKELLAGSRIMTGFVVPYGTAIRSEERLTIYSIANFSDTFYLSNRSSGDGLNIYHINDGYKANITAYTNGQVYLSNDGKTLVYDSAGGIYKVNGMLDKPEEDEVIVEENVEYFFATVAGDSLFFVSEDGEIFYQNGKATPVLVSNNATMYTKDYNAFRALSYNTSMWYNSADLSSFTNDHILDYSLFQGNTLFYSVDGELFSSSGNMGDAVDIDGTVESLTADPFNVFAYTNDKRYYRSSDGRNFDIMM